MEHYGVVLRKLRELNQLSIKEAAKHIKRSAGWLSEIENEKGSARIYPLEFERIVAAYNGEAHRPQFGIWVAKAYKPEPTKKEICFGGSILRYLRKKAQKSLDTASQEVGLSKAYLSYIETGVKPLSLELRNRLVRSYGYSPSSFKNFATEDKRAKNIPVRYKLDLLLKRMDESKIEMVFAYALETLRKHHQLIHPTSNGEK